MPLSDSTHPNHHPGEPVDRIQLLWRGITGRCPNCGKKLHFRGIFRVARRCPHCGLLNERSDGFYLGAVTWNYGLTVFGLLPLIVLAGFFGWIEKTTAISLALATALLGPILLYRWSWSLWLMSYYMVLLHELPVNVTGHIPVAEDE
jgi:uncharacterized protein (DUF983 family)